MTEPQANMTEPQANRTADTADRATGDGKPQLYTRFRKGQSGNPAGPAELGSPLRNAVTVSEILKIP